MSEQRSDTDEDRSSEQEPKKKAINDP